eukprot:366495-Chlamydomonas_euryale.AAC.2
MSNDQAYEILYSDPRTGRQVRNNPATTLQKPAATAVRGLSLQTVPARCTAVALGGAGECKAWLPGASPPPFNTHTTHVKPRGRPLLSSFPHSAQTPLTLHTQRSRRTSTPAAPTSTHDKHHYAPHLVRPPAPQVKENQRDTRWATWTCVLGFPVMGIWPPGTDGTDINSCDRSPSGRCGDDISLLCRPAPPHTRTWRVLPLRAEPATAS